jgi:cyclohexadienyl dehydratase
MMAYPKINLIFFKQFFVALVFAALSAPITSQAGSVLQRIKETSQLKVCIWSDYYGITYRNPKTQQLTGLDIDLSQELSKDLGVKVKYVESSFVKLIEDVKSDKCDVAMFAVGVLPQRAEHLKFTQPYMQSDIYAVTTRSNKVVSDWGDIDQPGVQVAVQAGTFMEPVMQAALKKAKLVSIKPPQTREGELEAGRVDVFMTDYPYSRRLLDNADWAKLITPPNQFYMLPYAYAVKPGDEEWLNRINDFVKQIKADGRLDAAAKRYRLSDIIRR